MQARPSIQQHRMMYILAFIVRLDISPLTVESHYVLASCIRVGVPQYQCSGLSTMPDFTLTLNDTGLSDIILRQVPHVIRLTPAVLLVSDVLRALSIPALALGITVRKFPNSRLRRTIGFKNARHAFPFSVTCTFFAFLFTLTSGLALKKQFGDAVGTFNVISQYTRTAAGAIFHEATLGSAFGLSTSSQA